MMGHAASPRPSLGPLYAQRSCWYCAWWGGQVYRIHGLCDKPGHSRVEASPRTGCAGFERLPGVDDDMWAPPVTPVRRNPPPRNYGPA